MGKNIAIILAAGKGKRMGSDVAKQYLCVHGKPILYYAIKAFEYSEVDEIILVTGEHEVNYCKNEIVEKYNFSKVKAIVPGGAERYNSVYYGLQEIVDGKYVLVHDGARPCITPEIINRTLKEVKEKQACVVGVPVKDTIKVVNKSGIVEQTPDRASLYITQTPQAFSYDIINRAYTKLFEQNEINVTDDAMVVESMLKQSVHMVMGDYCNIKVTTPEDLIVASEFLKSETKE